MDSCKQQANQQNQNHLPHTWRIFGSVFFFIIFVTCFFPIMSRLSHMARQKISNQVRMSFVLVVGLKLGEIPKYLKSTLLPKTDIEPENTPLEKEKHLQSNQFV